MILKEDFIIDRKHQKPILIDITCPSEEQNLPVIIFCHGYKGFKDWVHGI